MKTCATTGSNRVPDLSKCSKCSGIKGYISDETHHEMFRLVIGGKKTSIRTRISHGAKENGDQLLTLMSRQIGLSKTELYRLVDCPMNGEKLKTLLVARGKVRL